MERVYWTGKSGASELNANSYYACDVGIHMQKFQLRLMLYTLSWIVSW